MIGVMSPGSATTGRRILAAIVADYRVRFAVGPTWRELSDKLGIPPAGDSQPKSGSPEWIAWQAALSELIPALIATGWLADVRGTERSLHPGPRWEAAGTSWLEHQATVPNVLAYHFQHGQGVRPSVKEPSDVVPSPRAHAVPPGPSR